MSMKDKHKAESWDDLKKWLKNLKKTESNLKEFADMILGGMKDILQARQDAVGIHVASATDEDIRKRSFGVGLAARTVMLIVIVLAWWFTLPAGTSGVEAMVRLIMYVVLVAFVFEGSRDE